MKPVPAPMGIGTVTLKMQKEPKTERALKVAFSTWWAEDVLEKSILMVHTCSTEAAVKEKCKKTKQKFLDLLDIKERLISSFDKDWEHRMHMLLLIQPQLEQEFMLGYSKDPFFHKRIIDKVLNLSLVVTLSGFQKG